VGYLVTIQTDNGVEFSGGRRKRDSRGFTCIPSFLLKFLALNQVGQKIPVMPGQ